MPIYGLALVSAHILSGTIKVLYQFIHSVVFSP